METDFIRDAIMTTAIFGFFAMGWFGWAQENPPKKWVLPLAIASIFSGLLAIAGAILAYLNWSAPSALSGGEGMKVYGVVVGIEVAVAAAGAILLKARKLQRFTCPWISLVVAVHFFALAGLFQDPWFHVLAAIGTVFAIGSVFIAKKYNLTISAVCGALTGALLLVFAVRGLLLFLG